MSTERRADQRMTDELWVVQVRHRQDDGSWGDWLVNYWMEDEIFPSQKTADEWIRHEKSDGKEYRSVRYAPDSVDELRERVKRAMCDGGVLALHMHWGSQDGEQWEVAWAHGGDVCGLSKMSSERECLLAVLKDLEAPTRPAT